MVQESTERKLVGNTALARPRPRLQVLCLWLHERGHCPRDNRKRWKTAVFAVKRLPAD